MSARLVVVDDEPALLRLMHTYLSKLGYQVHSCADGAATEVAFSGEEVDLLVIDLTLPDASGDDLGVRLARAHPALRVLICSGYPFSPATLPEDVRARFASLQKPFVPRMLADSVERLLTQVKQS